jgi:hypothetical protein
VETPTTPPATVAVAAPSPAPSDTAVAGPTGPTPTVDPATAAQLQKIETDAASLRGLKPKTDVPEHFLSSADLKENLKEQIDEEYSPSEGKEDATELWIMRLIDDPSIDLYQLQIDLLGEQVLGYYDIKKKELFVRNDEQPLDPEAQETLAHEFVHSLQDEYYDLQKLRPENSHNSDRDAGVTALVEGDATVSGLLYAQKYMSQEDFQKLLAGSETSSTTELDKAPAYIRESLLFPYSQGVEFALALYQQGGFAALNRALADPPQSSEQILHPDKYLAAKRDAPLPVTLPPLTDTLGTGWTLDDYDTLGEFDLGMMLKTQGVDDPEAVAGWGGARYAYYKSDSDTGGLVIMGTRWDTTKDAGEFDTALRESLAKAQRQGEVWQDGDRYAAVYRAGDQVMFVGGTDRALVERVLGTLK